MSKLLPAFNIFLCPLKNINFYHFLFFPQVKLIVQEENFRALIRKYIIDRVI